MIKKNIIINFNHNIRLLIKMQSCKKNLRGWGNKKINWLLRLASFKVIIRNCQMLSSNFLGVKISIRKICLSSKHSSPEANKSSLKNRERVRNQVNQVKILKESEETSIKCQKLVKISIIPSLIKTIAQLKDWV